MTESVGSILALRLAATALSLGLAVWSARGIAALSEVGAVHNLAMAIEAGGEPRLELIDEFDQSGILNRVVLDCDAATLRALATVRLKELDLAFVDAEPERADRAYDGAEAAVRKSLSCSPFDGLSWLRLAILDTARRGPSSSTTEYVRLSHWTAPSEGWIVRARVNFAGRLFAAGLKGLEPELRSDIRTLVNHDSERNVVDMYLAAPESVRIVYREWVELAPGTRRSNLTKAVEGHHGK